MRKEKQDDSCRFLEALVNGHGSISCQVCAFPRSWQEPGVPGGSAASPAPTLLPELRASPGAAASAVVAARGEMGSSQNLTQALRVPSCLFACLSPCACPAARSPPAAAQVPQCSPFPAAAHGSGGGRHGTGREEAGAPLPAAPGLLCPGPVPKPCRATPAPAGVTCGNPWMNSGVGDPPSPQRNRGLGSTGLTDFCHI